MDFFNRAVDVKQETRCLRCGCEERDNWPTMKVHLGHFTCRPRGFGDSDLGDRVNRMMGWN